MEHIIAAPADNTKAPEVSNERVTKQFNMQGLQTEYATANKWIAYLPIENVLGKKYTGLELHITRFSLPQMVMGSTTASYKGYTKETPTKVMNYQSQELTLEYIVDANWTNYKSLYLWMSEINGSVNRVVDEKINPITPSNYIPMRVYLLDQYKNKIIQFVFEHCWIKIFNDLALEYSNSGEVHHSFTIVYDDFHIDTETEYFKE